MARQLSKQKAPKKGYGILWLITGILIGLFIASLSFLKKHVTVVEEPQKQVAVTTAAVPVAKRPQLIPVQKAATSKAGAVPGQDAEHYDFYTMLPKMQMTQQDGQNQTTPATTTVVKPTKPLAVAEQNMLAPTETGTAHLNPPTAQPVATNSPTAPAQVVTPKPANVNATPTQVVKPLQPAQAPVPVAKPAPAPKPIVTDDDAPYRVLIGTFNAYNKADARKAELLMGGVDSARIESFKNNGTTWYRVFLGPFPDKTAAKQQLANLQQNNFSGTLEKA